jgi:microsomal dipeptidase-like Zn-dependent dipeptidase
MDLTQSYGAPPREGYAADILAELRIVEDHVAAHSGQVALAHSPAELDALLGGGRPVLVHCIEGGFQLGHDPDEIRENVRALAAHGVAYVTVAHLFWRQVATNAPALPFLPDWLYHLVFRQPDLGLSALGRAAVEAMADEGILVDVTHMSAHSIEDTFALLDGRDPGGSIPVIATHMAARLGKLEYCLPEETIARIAARGGVMGLILCRHYISDGLRRQPSTFEQSLDALARHIDRIREITGSYDHIAIGSDLDGYIKPALAGLEHLGRMSALQKALADRYGAVVAEQIASANALRVLRAGWRGAPPVTAART